MSLNVSWENVKTENVEFVKENALNLGMWLMIIGVNQVTEKTLPVIRKRLKLQSLIGKTPSPELFNQCLGMWANVSNKTDTAYLKEIYRSL